MLLIAEVHRDFECKGSHIFKFVSNPENFSLWFPGIVRVENNDDLPRHTVGKSYKVDFSQGAVLTQSIMKIVKIDPPNSIIIETDLEPFCPRFSLSVRQTIPNHCLLSLKIHSDISEPGEQGLVDLRRDFHTRVRTAMLNLNTMFGSHIFDRSTENLLSHTPTTLLSKFYSSRK